LWFLNQTGGDLRLNNPIVSRGQGKAKACSPEKPGANQAPTQGQEPIRALATEPP
jgi:hypothetical protein